LLAATAVQRPVDVFDLAAPERPRVNDEPHAQQSIRA